MANQLVFEQKVVADEEKIGAILGLLESDTTSEPESGYQEENMVLRSKMDGSGAADEGSFVAFDSLTGEIRTAAGERVGILSAEILGAFCDAIHDKIGEEVRDVLYSTGVEWGSREFRKFKAEVEHEKKMLYHLRNMGLNEFKTRFNNLLSRSGWGGFSIEQKYDFIFIHLRNSAYAEMVSQHNMMYNDLFAGFFAGFFSELIGVDFDSVEMSLRKENYEAIYLLADESVTMTVRQWITDGKSYNEILSLLEKREYRRRKRKSADVKETYGADNGLE